MPHQNSPDEPVASARVNRCRDGTPLGIGIYLSGPDLVRLGIDPSETDAVDVHIRDGRLELVPGDGEPVIVKSSPPAGVHERWLEME